MKNNYRPMRPFVHQQNAGARFPVGDRQQMYGPPRSMDIPPPPLSSLWTSVHTHASHPEHPNSSNAKNQHISFPHETGLLNVPNMRLPPPRPPSMSNGFHKTVPSFNCPSGPRMNHHYMNQRLPSFQHKQNTRGIRPIRGSPPPTGVQQRMCVTPPSYAVPPPPPLMAQSPHQEHQNRCKAPDMSAPPPPPLKLLNNGFPDNISSNNSPSGSGIKKSYMDYGMPPFSNQRSPAGMPPRLHTGDHCRFRGPQPLLPRPPQWPGHCPSTEQPNPYNSQNQQTNRHQKFGRPNHGQKFARTPTLQQPPKKKRKRTNNKRDKPENNAYFCDICDRGFAVEELYKTHCDNHVQCDVDGCTYTAAAKLVKLHQECQHKTGFAKEIWKLESPAAVEKWIMSRKKNYPSAQNIAKKQTNLQTRQKRGDVLGTKRFDYRKNRGRHNDGYARRVDVDRVKDFLTDTKICDAGSGRDTTPATDTVNVERIAQGSIPDNPEIIDESTSESQGTDQDVQPQHTNGIAAMSNTGDEKSSSVASSHGVSDPLSLVLTNEENSSDSERSQSHAVSAEKHVIVANTSPTTGSLGTLITIYGNSDDSDEGPVEVFNVKDAISSHDSCNVANNSTSKHQQLSSASSNPVAIPLLLPPGEVSCDMLTHDNARFHEMTSPLDSSESQSNAERKRPYERNNRKNGQSKWKRNGNKVFRGRATLLEKLLAPDIRHERNVILQCVRYIVQQNFFDKKA